jgi:hypothetical protein
VIKSKEEKITVWWQHLWYINLLTDWETEPPIHFNVITRSNFCCLYDCNYERYGEYRMNYHPRFKRTTYSR